jgi:hypothetical protein
MPLNSRIRAELMGVLDRLSEEGKIHSREVLLREYTLFQQRFGPEALLALDGEQLLTRLLAPNCEPKQAYETSLAYELNFKVRPVNFGNIGRGINAFAFGAHFSTTDNEWVVKEDKKKRPVSTAYVVQIVEGYRTELVAAVAALDRLPRNGSDNDYRQLQQDIELAAPTLCNRVWMHKYLHMMRPDYMDDFHNKAYGDFHLIRLLQVPPPGDGLFLNAGRYVALARELDLAMNQLAAVLNSRSFRKYSHLSIPESFVAQYDGHLAVPTGRRGAKTTLYRNNVVVVRSGQFVSRIGRLLADCDFESLESEDQRVPVRWYDETPWTLPKQEKGEGLTEIRDKANRVAIEERLAGR